MREEITAATADGGVQSAEETEKKERIFCHRFTLMDTDQEKRKKRK